jgi:hypothetical protein
MFLIRSEEKRVTLIRSILKYNYLIGKHKERGMKMRRTDQYMFTIRYDKTFLQGNLKGITVKVEYGTCDSHRIPDGSVFQECITKNRFMVSNFQISRNY